MCTVHCCVCSTTTFWSMDCFVSRGQTRCMVPGAVKAVVKRAVQAVYVAITICFTLVNLIMAWFSDCHIVHLFASVTSRQSPV